jgi:hypothetical protein
VANAFSYPGFFVVASIVTRFARRIARELDEARRLAIDRGARLAAEAATNREHRLLHDSALQTLEAIASGSAGGPTSIRRHADREAAVLRLALRRDNRSPIWSDVPLASASPRADAAELTTIRSWS